MTEVFDKNPEVPYRTLLVQMNIQNGGTHASYWLTAGGGFADTFVDDAIRRIMEALGEQVHMERHEVPPQDKLLGQCSRPADGQPLVSWTINYHLPHEKWPEVESKIQVLILDAITGPQHEHIHFSHVEFLDCSLG